MMMRRLTTCTTICDPVEGESPKTSWDQVCHPKRTRSDFSILCRILVFDVALANIGFHRKGKPMPTALWS
jgi:hypothetical protein